MAPPDDTKIREQLAREQTRLAEIEAQREQVQARIEALRASLIAMPSRPEPVRSVRTAVDAPSVLAPAEKIELFRRLFRGREDVFPKLWVNDKKGAKGYAPACSNEWERGVCDKPRVKCGECPNQAFIPVGDQIVLEHLTGRHVIGVYPMLADETCWFLAVDFDKGCWREDVMVFVDTCHLAGVPAAVERSRSGNGAHVWFFFAAPVAAAAARKMGCYLITETMARRHQLGMKSYDRLFPNQDTMPAGGFGNLIALPLQHEPRKAGNTVFLDEQLEPIADQWAFLAAVPRLERATVEDIAHEAARKGQILGVRLAESGDGDEDKPWTRSPSRRPRTERIPESLPAKVRGVSGQRFFVEKAGLPSPLLNQIKRLAAFQNPEFYKKQNLRLSTALTPRIIACAEDDGQYISLPRGCQGELEAELGRFGVALVVEDKRECGGALDLRFHGELTPVQEQAARTLLAHDTGVFVAPPGVGKTVLGTFIVASRGRTTLVLVHRRPLLEQWVAQLAMFLGIEEGEIGQIRGGRRKPNGRLDVAMIQSLVRLGEVNDLVTGYGHVIVDECHHLPAVSFERVLSELKSRYLLGLTATPQRRDGLQPITEMQLGPVRFAVDPKSQAARRPFDHRLMVRETSFRPAAGGTEPSIHDLYRQLACDEARNRVILADVMCAIGEGRSPILLTERRDHLELVAEKLRGFVRHLVVLQGGMTEKERRETSARLAAIPDGEERLVLATGKYIGEGFDDARLDTLFLAMPVSWKGTIVQYAGRLQRLHPNKTEVRVFDYVDREVPVLLRMFEKRLRTYRAIGYARGEAPLGFGEPRDDPEVEPERRDDE